MTPEEKNAIHKRVMERLAALGWIEIVSAKGAQTAISITPKGEASLAPILEFIRSFDDEPFSDDLLGALTGVVKRIREIIDSHDGDEDDLGEI